MPTAITDGRISEKCERRLLLLGVNLKKLPKKEGLPNAIESHADILMFAHKNKIITSAEYCDTAPWVFTDIREYSPKTEILFSSESYGSEYPSDALFNVLVVRNYAFMKSDTASEAVRRYTESIGLKTVTVKQGYPACTVLAFGNSAITADEGMARALGSCDIKVTLIKNGGITLPPYEYGFIGGASGVYKDRVYFLGNLSTHPDADVINDAIKAEGYTAVSLSDEPLSDLGRIIFIE